MTAPDPDILERQRKLKLRDPWLCEDFEALWVRGEAFTDWAERDLATRGVALFQSGVLAVVVLATVDEYLANPLTRDRVEDAIRTCHEHIDRSCGARP